MYGYIRPNRGELRVREYEHFQSVYCGLCRTLGKRSGALARFAVNYDLTFLALLLNEDCGGSRPCFCPAHPFHRRRCLCGEASMEAVADFTIILAWWKLTDEIRDGGPGKRFLSRLGRLLLRGAYRRSSQAQPDFTRAAAEGLARLEKLEREASGDLDRCADCFASILASAAGTAAPLRQRPMRELLYHVGRSVYILDAVDDFEEDVRRGCFNPLRCRFGDTLGMEEKESLRQTLNLSQQQAVHAWLLLPESDSGAVIENILTIGLPQMCDMVLSGQWKKRKELRREYSRRTWSGKI